MAVIEHTLRVSSVVRVTIKEPWVQA